MRALSIFALALLPVFAGPVAAVAADSPDSAAPVAAAGEAVQPLAEQSVDALFATLAAGGDAAEGAEREIQRRWAASGSDTVDLLMQWAQEAVARQDIGTALSYLDSVVLLRPDYIEGWNTRAALHVMRDEYGKAISDLERVIRLEPRHFVALTGLGMMLQQLGRDKDGLAMLERALSLDPRLGESLGKTVEQLRRQVDGVPI
ncbi:tetratricopeptide repeat protein [Prosthecomicrobium pneumaticum]|uniref:Tetratricopeptide (TPR) repeat protein n=1 Tax=Prosthecomicrobium pneumaticum TaxID=81895 RepID=A0A7W9FLA1_9HYPH|nr:tetratricopeptide repeat protein [Prosthecomicrobium pneumaticum]MBB5752579.1 tetratricopeptide (TPR) repeat protein [Prosthecomicrobium pneumaticum]